MPSRKTADPPSLPETPTPAAIRELLAYLLAGAVGGTEAKWRKLIGEVEALPIVLHPRSNWRIEPTGTTGELDAIQKAADHVRGAHPYVASVNGKGTN